MSVLKNFNIYFLPILTISSIGILANLMLLFAFIKDPLKCFRNSATYLVGNLAFSDFLFNAANIAHLDQKAKPEVLQFLKFLSFYLSMLTIASIALDRYLMITYPFKHRIFMSGNKMALWIAFVWILSSIHPIVKITISDGSDHLIKAGVGLGLIILTGILYGKIYFALRKQAKSMFGKKAASSSRQGEYSSNKRILKDGETSFCNPGCIEKQNSYAKIESVNQQDGCILTQDDRAENHDEGAQNQNERAQNHDERAQNHDEHAQNQNERAQTQNESVQYGHAKNQNERVECLNHPVRDQINRSQSQDIGNNSTMNVFQISSKSPKNSQAINTAKEQKFLNTIIIIACIAVVTVAPATIYSQLYATAVAELNPEANMILDAVLLSIFSLNFAVNPFVYVLRLKRYRKTFKLVYGWD